MRKWEELSKEQAGLRVQRQVKPNVTTVSLDSAASQDLAAYLARRCFPGAIAFDRCFL